MRFSSEDRKSHKSRADHQERPSLRYRGLDLRCPELKIVEEGIRSSRWNLQVYAGKGGVRRDSEEGGGRSSESWNGEGCRECGNCVGRGGWVRKKIDAKSSHRRRYRNLDVYRILEISDEPSEASAEVVVGGYGRVRYPGLAGEPEELYAVLQDRAGNREGPRTTHPFEIV